MKEIIFDVQRFAPGDDSSSSVTYSAANSITSGGTYDSQTYTSTSTDENAVLISTTDTVIINNPTVTKSGGPEHADDNYNFYGINSAVMAMGGGTTSIIGGTVTTNGVGANGIFSYGGNGGNNSTAGDGTTVIISDVSITTSLSGSGGIMTTGGGNTKAYYLTIETSGESSAPIRTDRGGGNVTVTGGTYTSNGLGSPAIYSTADVKVISANLTSNLSEGVCIEGENSVALTDCTLTASNTQTNGNAQFLDSVILYQSQSGDAADGTSTFSMYGGTLNSKSGHVLHVTNTTAVINLENVTINNTGDEVLLSVCDDGWSGASNVATLNLSGTTTYEGNLLVGDDSTLTLNITGGATLNGGTSGEITNAAGTSISTSLGTINVTIDENSYWALSGNTSISSFSGDASHILNNNFTLYVNGVALDGTTDPSEGLNVNNSDDNTTITGTSYADTINNIGSNVTINALGGDDTIISEHGAATVNNVIDAGDGKDSVLANGSFITVYGGADDDTIAISGSNNVYIYNSGDGNDNISGFDSNDTLVIGDGTGTYSTISNDADLILTVGDGQITLGDAAGLETLNIQGSLIGGDSTVGVTINNSSSNITITGTDYADSIYSSVSHVTIDALGGDDTIYTDGFSSINAGEGDNFISLSGNRASIITGSGNDTIYASGTSSINAGDGDNLITLASGTITAGAGKDTIYVSGSSSINAGAGANFISLSGSFNTISTGAGNDTIYVDSIAGNLSNASINAGEGANFISLRGRLGTISTGAGNDTIYTSSYSSINSGDGDDVIYVGETTGFSHAFINAGVGANFISLGGSLGTISTGEGNDTIYGGGSSSINAGAGANFISLSDGYSTITTGDGANFISLSGDSNTITTGDGNDTIYGGGNSSINAGAGANFISLSGSRNTITTGSGNDSIYGGATSSYNNTAINAGAGANFISLSGSNNTINTGDGDDTVYVTEGYNLIDVGKGDNVIFGASEYDTLYIGGNYSTVKNGDDLTVLTEDGTTILQDIGTTTLVIDGTYTSTLTPSGSSSTWATVTPAEGAATVLSTDETVANGSAGNDFIITETIEGDTTARAINGNGGDDNIVNVLSNVTIQTSGGKDFISNLNNDKTFIDSGAGDDNILNALHYEIVTLDSGKETLSNPYGDTSIVAGAGNDTVVAIGGNKVSIAAGEGDDYIAAFHSYYQTIDGGTGDDSIEIAEGHYEYILGGEGSDTIIGTILYETLKGDWAMGGYATIDGGAGADYISVGYSNNASINGGDGNDTIITYGANSEIYGGDGDDEIILISNGETTLTAAGTTISGGAGDDTITGDGSGIVYQYNEDDGDDNITGFTANDTLLISGTYSTATSGDDLIVTVGDNNITLQDTATLDNLNIIGDDDLAAAAFVEDLQKRLPEYGYPTIAGMFFHPEEYHGFDTLPSSYYAESETLTINSSDGLELTGYHYTPQNPNDKWVILVHGYGHNHRHMNGFAMQYLANNYQVLMVDQRAAGTSQGEWLTMGAAEGEDVALWTQKIASLNSNAKITLHGVSMGAATAMLAAANSKLVNVTSLVEDCGYTSVLKLVDIVQSAFPGLADPAFVSLVSDTSGKLTGHKLTEAAPIDSIGAATMPSMFITGTADQIISPSMLESLYSASGAEVKEIFTVEGATHGVSGLKDSIGYGNAVFRFNAEAAGEGWITTNITSNISLRGTKYDDTITTSGANVTISTGKGDDTINNSGNILLKYNTGDGYDVISSFSSSDTLIIDGGTGEYATATSSDDVIVTVSEGKVTLQGAANVEKLNIEGNAITAQEINNTVDSEIITGTIIDDTISNHGSNVTINALAGDDYISNVDNNKTLIDAGAGDDLIINSLFYTVLTDASGNETLQNPYSGTTINAGAGDDTINISGGSTISVDTGDGDDSIYSKHSYNVTINGGAGADFIEINEGHNEYILGGDDADTIIGETVTGEWAMGGYATIDGGAGADYVLVGYSNNSSINGGEGNDTIITYGANSEINGGSGDDVITLITNSDRPTLTSAGSTVTGGTGNDTITGDGSGVIYKYNSGDGNDVLIGVTDSDTLVIDGDTYRTSTSGNDLIVKLIGSQNTITLKNAATVDVNIDGEWFTGKTDKEGTEIENPVATIVYDGRTYYYESVARASEDADSDSTVTVIANSTETATISTTKNLAIQFAESGLGVYNVLSGNFLSYGTIENADFSIATGRILTNNGVNYLQIANGSTATLDNYEVTGTSNGYTFSLQNNPFAVNGASYYGEGTATFDTSGKVTLTSGAIVNDSSLVTSDAGIVLAAGNYTLNGNAFTTTATHTVYLDSDGAHFNVSSDAVTYNTFTFNGNGTASIKGDLPTLSAGVEVNRPDRAMVVLTEKGQNTIDGRGFQMIKDLSDGITVGAVDNGIGAAHIIPYESFPEDAGKLFAEEALIYGDDSYTVRLNEDGIKSIYGISAGSTVRGKAYFEGEVDPEGSVLQMAVDGSGSYTFGDKTYTINGDIDSVNVVGVTSRFYNDDSGLLRNVYYLNGTLSGEFSSAVTINQSSMPLQIAGDTNVDIYATDSAKASDDANKSSISSAGNVSVISGVGSGASIVSAGGATKVSTNEEGEFLFRSSEDNLQGQQAFTVSGDSSVDFILRNFTDANGNPTMQVEGINNFENGLYTITKETEYHAINVGESITASDELVMQFSDKATFVIADSQIVSVSGIDTLINRLKGDVTVHATHAVTVNELDANVVGDTDFDVIVSDSKTVEIANISAGATVKANNVNVKTDNNGDFTFATDTYKIEDTNNSVTFLTGRNGVVNNIADFAGTMQSSAQNVTVNGTAFTTSNTDASIVSAGTGISAINGLASGDTVGGALDMTTVLMAAASDTLKSILTVNEISYTLAANSEGVSITGNVIDGLETGGTLEISHAGKYLVNDTALTVNVGDIIIGTAENSAYIYDSKNVPLDIDTMTDDEIAAQAGISNTYSNVETNTMQANALVEQGGSALDGSMALALDNSNSNVGQTADFSANTGRKRVTLEGGEQGVKFNDEGGNVAVISSDAAGEKNISLGGGGDLAIIEGTQAPVNITAGAGPDSIVTAGQNVSVTLGDGATKIIPNAGNVALENYNPATGAGIQANDYADLSRAIVNGNIQFGNGVVSLGSSAAVSFASEDDSAYHVNLFNNKGIKQRVGFTNSNGGELDASGERENMFLIGNANGDKGASTFTAGSGDDVAFGGAGDTFDLGAGNNSIYLDEDRENSSGATINQTATNGKTEVNGFKFGFGDSNDRININLSASVSYKNGQLTFNIGGAMLVVNGSGSADLAESADLIEDENFAEGTTLDEITPITYEQGEYQLAAIGKKDSLNGGVEITFAQG